MGITRMSDLKKQKTGAKCKAWRKKRNHLLGRPAASTRIGPERVHKVRVRGGSIKHRALRLDHGFFSWSSENATRKTRILSTSYHPSDNEFVRTNTLTRGSIVTVDASPFKGWYERHYGKGLGRSTYKRPEQVKDTVQKRWADLAQEGAVDPALVKQFDSGKLLAAITSRPGQVGKATGYILEGDELAFYQEQMSKRSGKKAA